MIAWEKYLPFCVKSNADLLLERYSDEQLEAMVKSIGEVFMRSTNKNEKALLTKIINDIYLIYHTQRK